jgi:trigger factor
LKIEKELLDDHQIQLDVEIDVDPFEAAKRQAARKIAKKVRIPGFRPGKAPYNVILRHVGEGAIIEDALDILIEDIYPKILGEAEINPYGSGSLESIEKLDPPTFQFVIPLAPEVELGDYKALEIPYEIPAVEPEAIEAQINELRQQQAITVTSEEPAQVGDRVFYQVSADRVEVEEGQESQIIPERFNSAIIEAKGEEQNLWPYLGFSQNLVGMSIDEEKDVVYTYPEDHEDEELQGVEAVIHIVVTNVQTVSLPEMDDEFAKSASDYDSIDELRTSIEENLHAEIAQQYDSDYNNQVLQTLIEMSTIKYPPQVVEHEKKEMISNLEYRLSQQGITQELYLQIRGISEEEFNDEMDLIAVDRIIKGLILAEVAKIENLEVDQEQLAAETGRTVDIITQGMTPKDAKEFQKSGNLLNLMNSIMVDLMTQKSMEYLRAIAKGDPIPEEDADEGTAQSSDELEETIDTSEKQKSESNLEAEAVSEETVSEEPAENPKTDAIQTDTIEEDSSPDAEENPEEEKSSDAVDKEEPEIE